MQARFAQLVATQTNRLRRNLLVAVAPGRRCSVAGCRLRPAAASVAAAADNDERDEREDDGEKQANPHARSTDL